MKIGSLNPQKFSFSKHGEKSLGIKSPILWGIEGGKMYPLVYFHKPKHVSQEEFNQIIERMSLYLSKGRLTLKGKENQKGKG